MDLQFEWDDVEAFVRQPDGSLFSWSERFHCFNHLIYGIVSHSFYTTLFINFEAVELWSYCGILRVLHQINCYGMTNRFSTFMFLSFL